MVQIYCKVWGIGMFSIVALTTSNLLLSMHLLRVKDEENTTCSSPVTSRSKTWKDTIRETNYSNYLEFLQKLTIVVTDRDKNLLKTVELESNPRNKSTDNADTNFIHISQSSFFSIDPNLGRFDNQRLFKTFDKVFTGPNYHTLVDVSPVCLATQSSVDRLFWVTQVSKYWNNAPISLAVFTPDVEYSIARAYLQYLTTCYPFLGEKITVHFTFPKQFPPKEKNITLQNLPTLCEHPVAVLKELLKKRPPEMLKWREKLQYPQNLLRNVARKNCGTEWVFLTDVDIIPVPNLADDLRPFLQSKEATTCRKCAFVIPTYELHEKAPLPHNRTLLLQLVSAGRARPFHQKVFVYNQHATNFSRWEEREKIFPSETAVQVSHDVTSFEFFYEPFYVARDNVPQHDERFLGYGFTRNTQVYEMYVGGFTFKVLSPVFTLHWGMQIKRGRPSWRERQNNANRKLFEGFKREMFARYQRDPLGMISEKRKIKRINGRFIPRT